MPILENVQTTSIEGDPFRIPNTDISIWKVKLELPNGERILYSTMSKAIATVGFKGDIESYINDKGKEYIRQVKKEQQTASAWDNSEKEESIAKAVALKAAVEIAATTSAKSLGSELVVDAVLQTADTFLAWLKGGSEDSDPKDQPSSSAQKKSQSSEISETRTKTTSGNEQPDPEWDIPPPDFLRYGEPEK